MAYSVKKKKKGSTETVQDDEHSLLVGWVNEADDATVESRELSEKCMDYRDGKQWTATEKTKLAAQKQAATVINRIKPKVDGLLGMEKTQRTTAKAFPRTPKHEHDADASTESIRYVLQDNFYSELRSSVFDDILVPGTGGYDVTVKPSSKEDFRITIKWVPWDRIIFDPHSRRKDFTDARYLGQVVWMDYEEAVDLYPDSRDVLESMQNGSSTYDDKPRWMDNQRKRVKLVELYYYKGSDVWYAIFTRGGWVKKPEISPYVNEEGETEWCYEFASAFVDREGMRYGAVLQYLDVQDEINKRRSKALHLMSVRQIAVMKGAVEDINKTRRELAKPDGVIELTQPLTDTLEILKTGDMAAAQFNLLTEAKAEIDAVGYNAAVAGKDQNAISGVALKQRQMSGQTELAPLFDVLKHLDHRVYRKVWNRIRQYWKAEKWIRVTDDEQNLKWVGLNKPMTRGEEMLEQAKSQGLPPEQLQILAQRIAIDPMAKEVVGKKNDLAELDVDIVIDDAPDAVTTQIEDFQVLGEMVKSGFPIPPEAVILASPLSHKERILKLMKEKPQLPPEVQEQMKKMQEEGKKLQEENERLKQDQQTEMMRLQLDKAKAEEELKLEREKASATLDLERSKAEAEINLEREKAAANVSLEKEKIAGNVEVQKTKLKGDLAVKSIELGTTVLDPEEEERKVTQAKSEEEERLKLILDESKRQAAEIAASVANSILQPLLEQMNRPKTKTAKYKGETITVVEH